MDLIFLHKQDISKHNIKYCQNIVEYLRITKKNQWITGKELANHFNVSTVDIRKHIQIIREYNEGFLDRQYIIASNKGYKVTSTIREIKKFAKSIQTRATSALAQVDQAYKITKKGW